MFSIYLLLAVAFIALVDFVPKLFNAMKKSLKVPTSYTRIPEYYIMPTVYGNISYLDNLPFLKNYSQQTIICTSDHETDEFYKDLRKVCKQYGFRYAICKIPVKNGAPVKNAYSIYKGFFTRKHLPIKVNSPCILIDADTYALKNVHNLVREFLSTDAEIASLRCEVAEENTTIQKLQAYEYRLAMDNRKMDPWLTSGACNMAYAHVYRDIFKHHSDFFAGGDIEIGKIAFTSGRRVRHIDFTFYTDAPSTISDWFNQRIIWYAGGFRHYVMSINKFGWYHFFLLFYNAILIYLLFPIRWMEVIMFPELLLLLIFVGWVYGYLLTAGKGWRPTYLLLPLYSFVQTMIIVPFGVVRYSSIALQTRGLGRFKGAPHQTQSGMSHTLLTNSLNTITAVLVLYLAYYFTMSRIVFWAVQKI